MNIRLVVVFFITQCVLAQQPIEPDSTVLALTKFEEVFYSAIKEKSIDNYDKAIQILLNNQDIKDNKEVLYFELARNYHLLNDYNQAKEYYQKTLKEKPNFRWALDGLYQIHNSTKQYKEAIEYLKLLTPFSNEYQELLVSIYMKTTQYDLALELIDELNKTLGKRAQRTTYREQILKMPKYQKQQKEAIEKELKNNSDDPSSYIALIVQYANENNLEKSYQVAKKLQENVPNSPWSQVYLFKDYLDKEMPEQAWQALEKSLKSDEVSIVIKHRMFNEWLIAQKNYPNMEPTIEKSINYLITDTSVPVAKEVGKFYQNKQQWQKAIKYYQLHSNNHDDDIENLLLWCLALKNDAQIEVLNQKSQELLSLYPSQPQFYWYQGWVLQQQKEYKKAKDILLKGLDYVIDNNTLEQDFYGLLVEVFTELNDQKNKEKYQKLIKK